jgi:hypothetical protein
VHVHVDQAGAHDQTARHVDDSDAVRRREIASDPRDAIAVDQHVEHAIAPVHRIDDAATPQENQPHRSLIPGVSQLRTRK